MIQEQQTIIVIEYHSNFTLFHIFKYFDEVANVKKHAGKYCS